MPEKPDCRVARHGRLAGPRGRSLTEMILLLNNYRSAHSLNWDCGATLEGNDMLGVEEEMAQERAVRLTERLVRGLSVGEARRRRWQSDSSLCHIAHLRPAIRY